MRTPAAWSEGLGIRAEAVNALIAQPGLAAPGLAPLAADGELDGDRRRVYERGLDLPKGALAWGRFEGPGAELAGLPLERVVARLLAERVAVAAGDAAPAIPPEAYLAELFADLGLQPRQTLWLTGSPAVRKVLEAAGASAPPIRGEPSPLQLRGYAVAVMCRGPVGHKATNPWTNAIERMAPFTGPVLIHAASSNISGIVRSVHGQRAGLKAYVDRWRAAR